MKNILPLLLLLAFVGLALLTACGPNKKLQASKTHVEQLKKDSIDTHLKLENEKRRISKNHTEQIKKEAIETPNTNNNDTKFVAKKKSPTSGVSTASKPLPPEVVATIFKTKYPSATEIVWTKRMPIVKVRNKDTRDYKAHFVLENRNNSVILF
jgi:hypothetical protein